MRAVCMACSQRRRSCHFLFLAFFKFMSLSSGRGRRAITTYIVFFLWFEILSQSVTAYRANLTCTFFFQ